MTLKTYNRDTPRAARTMPTGWALAQQGKVAGPVSLALRFLGIVIAAVVIAFLIATKK